MVEIPCNENNYQHDKYAALISKACSDRTLVPLPESGLAEVSSLIKCRSHTLHAGVDLLCKVEHLLNQTKPLCTKSDALGRRVISQRGERYYLETDYNSLALVVRCLAKAHIMNWSSQSVHGVLDEGGTGTRNEFSSESP